MVWSKREKVVGGESRVDGHDGMGYLDKPE